MNEQEIQILVYTIDNILEQPLLEITRQYFINFKNLFLSKKGTQDDVEKLNNLIQLKNDELTATYGLLEIGKDVIAANILVGMKRKFEEI